MREMVFFVGGPLDGEFGELTEWSSRKGFSIVVTDKTGTIVRDPEDEDDYADDDLDWGYFFHEWGDGFRVFKLGKR